MIPTIISDHELKALSLLIEQYKGKPVIEGILKAWSRQGQEIENVLWDLIEARKLNNATGPRLDAWGAFVNKPRDGRTDEEYRAVIRIQIRVNRSFGRVKDIYQIARLALVEDEDFFYDPEYPAQFTIRAYNIPTWSAKALIPALTEAAGAGVRALLSFTDDPGYFYWSSVYVTPSKARGMGSVYQQYIGGSPVWYLTNDDTLMFGSVYSTSVGVELGTVVTKNIGGKAASIQEG